MRYSFRLAERDRRLDGDEERGTPTRRRSRKRRCSYVAADHLNPEEKPAAANVVRFFDNGEKDVVKLIFDNREAQTAADPEGIICTPNHRFYVVGKGWVQAQDLQSGDLCLSATGERIAFISRENLAEKQRVYNFEVEEKHTFYIDSKKMLLVHNQCGPGSPGGQNVMMPDGSILFISDTIDPGIPLPPYIKRPQTDVVILPPNIEDQPHLEIQYSCDNPNIRNDNISRLKEDGVSQAVIDNLGSTLEKFLTAYYNYDSIQQQALIRNLEKHPRHYSERFIPNRMNEFLDLDWKVLSNQEYLDKANNGWVITSIFLNETWRLCPRGEAEFHGAGCFKWVSESGRELVIKSNGVLEINPLFYGTFNFSSYQKQMSLRGTFHGIEDLTPYLFLGNIPNDKKIKKDANDIREKMFRWRQYFGDPEQEVLRHNLNFPW
jgi:hypothetical protein